MPCEGVGTRKVKHREELSEKHRGELAVLH